MRFIKFTIALVLVCIFSTSQGAFAAIGIGDTKATAIPYTPCSYSANNYACYSTALPLSSETDVDWFQWTNRTGITKPTDIWVTSPNGAWYGFTYQVINKYGDLIDFAYLNTQVGGTAFAPQVSVPADATLFLQVYVINKPIDFSSLYSFSFNIP